MHIVLECSFIFIIKADNFLHGKVVQYLEQIEPNFIGISHDTGIIFKMVYSNMTRFVRGFLYSIKLFQHNMYNFFMKPSVIFFFYTAGLMVTKIGVQR